MPGRGWAVTATGDPFDPHNRHKTTSQFSQHPRRNLKERAKVTVVVCDAGLGTALRSRQKP